MAVGLLAEQVGPVPAPSKSKGEIRGREALLLFVPFALVVALTFAYSPDDTFITLRYAYNVLHGHGAVFNPGQYVNGATSPAGLVLGIIAVAAPGHDAMFVAKLLSLLFGILAVWKGGRLLKTFDLPNGARYGGLVLMGMSPMLAFSSATGLETTVATFAITGLLLALRTGEGDRFWIPALYGALAVLARPEAILAVSFIMIAVVAVDRPRSLHSLISRARWWIVGPLLAEIVIVGWNRLYYGSLVPNTYAAKSGPLGVSLRDGARYLWWGTIPRYYSGVLPHSLLQLAIVALDGLLLIGCVVAAARWRDYGAVLAAVVAQGLFVLKSGGDWMPGARFLAPVAPCLVLLQALGGARVADWVTRALGRRRSAGSRSGWRWQAPLAVIFGGAIVATSLSFLVRSPVTNLNGVSDAALTSHSGNGHVSAVWAAEPKWFACARPGQLVATTEAGYGAFAVPDVRVLDLRGLNDREIATSAPASLKGMYGVTDVDWQSPTSVVGRVILRERPVLIYTFDGPAAPTALHGTYHLVSSDSQAGVRVYGLTGFRCTPR